MKNYQENFETDYDNPPIVAIPDKSPPAIYPVVGIGASAGGLVALESFFRQVPPDTGMAFVVVSHQSPDHTSLLPELLGKCTEMSTMLAADGMSVEPGCIYVNPPGYDLGILDGKFQLSTPSPRGTGHLPIDFFFRSLAWERRDRAICIVLSGTATDGTVGLRDIKASGGLAIAQDPTTAEFAGMPSSAIATRLVDYVLAPENMAAALLSYVGNLEQGLVSVAPASETIAPEVLEKILTTLRQRCGHDFARYKRNMIERRIFRRMVVTYKATAQDYARLLETDPLESLMLMKALLISVTNFFRDPNAYDVFAHSVLPQLLAQRAEGTVLRAWCPGCATGEEAYSLGIILSETMARLDRRFEFQIFGTDLDADAIDVARRGTYPAGIGIDVSLTRLENFFVPENGNYRVKKAIREKIVFAVQDLIKDPPFTKLDIIFCRNLLIYLDSALQRRVLAMFHYALSPGGLLFLGTSETLNGFDHYFKTADKQWRIFSRKEGTPAHDAPSYPYEPVNPDRTSRPLPKMYERSAKPDITTIAERILAATFAPPSAIVNERGDVFFIHGRAGAFLEPAAGKQPNNNILSMAREGLRLPLTSILRRAASHADGPLRERAIMKTNEGNQSVLIATTKLTGPESMRGLLLVTFTIESKAPLADLPSPSAGTDDAMTTDESASRIDVERELEYTRESLQDTIEELQSSNEELQSANEELQSSNEELETSREELQSLNEELRTVNTELESKVDQLFRARDDMQNLLDGIDIATIFLDNELKIRRYTRPAASFINMIDTDIGRPISDLVSNLNYDHLIDDAKQVIRALTTREVEVQAKDGTWCLMRIAPYRTSENVIEGVVVTFVNITKLKQAEEKAKCSV